ncbi:1-aminocyclopropane-1-carboxylate deaminase/D-cysteine desulfhydrase [Enterocloster citroniae]|uniref:1-aminocyclopropane-1-carboxylate deaminase/D-cysteine desulfhydrase n=1 Tax=Enterocloster citroniae TaxID=358743 RepID=UPI00349EB500
MEKKRLNGPMKPNEIDELLADIPRFQKGFFPTPFHRLDNLSADYGYNIYAKREDLSGPSNFGGNKVRKLEIIFADAIEKGYDTMISMGAYQTNSAMEFCQFCCLSNIKPIIYLADIHDIGLPACHDDIAGNMRLMTMMGAELHYVAKDPDMEGPLVGSLWNKVYRLMDKRKAELEAAGHKVYCVPSGCATDEAMVSFVWAFKEIMEQSAAAGVKLDYIFHSNGTGGSLPGMIVGKYLIGSDVEIISMCNGSCSGEDDLCNHKEMMRRVHVAFDRLGIEAPEDEWIRAQIHYDEDHYGKDYGEPTEEATEAMLKMASREGLFTDSVYTGKCVAGMLDYMASEKIPKDSTICFIHTGGTGALFAEEGLTGKITKI